MPVHKVKGGFKWGNHGHVYPTKAGAEKQAAAIFANGYHGDSFRMEAPQEGLTSPDPPADPQAPQANPHPGEWPGGPARNAKPPSRVAKGNPEASPK